MASTPKGVEQIAREAGWECDEATGRIFRVRGDKTEEAHHWTGAAFLTRNPSLPVLIAQGPLRWKRFEGSVSFCPDGDGLDEVYPVFDERDGGFRFMHDQQRDARLLAASSLLDAIKEASPRAIQLQNFDFEVPEEGAVVEVVKINGSDAWRVAGYVFEDEAWTSLGALARHVAVAHSGACIAVRPASLAEEADWAMRRVTGGHRCKVVTYSDLKFRDVDDVPSDTLKRQMAGLFGTGFMPADRLEGGGPYRYLIGRYGRSGHPVCVVDGDVTPEVFRAMRSEIHRAKEATHRVDDDEKRMLIYGHHAQHHGEATFVSLAEVAIPDLDVRPAAAVLGDEALVATPESDSLEARMHRALKAAWPHVNGLWTSDSATEEVGRLALAPLKQVADKRKEMLFALQTAWTFVHGSGNEALKTEVRAVMDLASRPRADEAPVPGM